MSSFPTNTQFFGQSGVVKFLLKIKKVSKVRILVCLGFIVTVLLSGCSIFLPMEVDVLATPKGTYLDDQQYTIERVRLSKVTPYTKAALLGSHYYRTDGQAEQCAFWAGFYQDSCLEKARTYDDIERVMNFPYDEYAISFRRHSPYREFSLEISGNRSYLAHNDSLEHLDISYEKMIGNDVVIHLYRPEESEQLFEKASNGRVLNGEAGDFDIIRKTFNVDGVGVVETVQYGPDRLDIKTRVVDIDLRPGHKRAGIFPFKGLTQVLPANFIRKEPYGYQSEYVAAVSVAMDASDAGLPGKQIFMPLIIPLGHTDYSVWKRNYIPDSALTPFYTNYSGSSAPYEYQLPAVADQMNVTYRVVFGSRNSLKWKMLAFQGLVNEPESVYRERIETFLNDGYERIDRLQEKERRVAEVAALADQLDRSLRGDAGKNAVINEAAEIKMFHQKLVDARKEIVNQQCGFRSAATDHLYTALPECKKLKKSLRTSYDRDIRRLSTEKSQFQKAFQNNFSGLQLSAIEELVNRRSQRYGNNLNKVFPYTAVSLAKVAGDERRAIEQGMRNWTMARDRAFHSNLMQAVSFSDGKDIDQIFAGTRQQLKALAAKEQERTAAAHQARSDAFWQSLKDNRSNNLKSRPAPQTGAGLATPAVAGTAKLASQSVPKLAAKREKKEALRTLVEATAYCFQNDQGYWFCDGPLQNLETGEPDVNKALAYVRCTDASSARRVAFTSKRKDKPGFVYFCERGLESYDSDMSAVHAFPDAIKAKRYSYQCPKNQVSFCKNRVSD
ncbi:hypothetical protein [Photobacterium sp. TY1-4]|uniref:hypothetical protein n=1 Tax=Photobacterium sp. TY1-4 TaxID=2899122 RepID=UPI0021BF15A9|nr:hypothetical protein [Photobacterium sp. TY1-4]UXI03024.1 hypothetical protein NH461_21495 [Photobacterium sp. TY1-4]